MTPRALRLRWWASSGVCVDWVFWPGWGPAWHQLRPSCSLQTLSLTQSALPRNHRIGLFTIQSPSHVQLFSDPTDCSPPGSFVHGILQASVLEWLPFPFLGDLPDPGSNPHLLHMSPALQADSYCRAAREVPYCLVRGSNLFPITENVN